MFTNDGIILLVVGLALLAGYAAHRIGARSHVPRVTLLLGLGVVCGPELLNVVPAQISDWFPALAQFALAVVGFLLGEEFVYKKDRHSPLVLKLALVVSIVTAVCVTGVAVLAGAAIELALVLGGIATATAPAATLDLVRETRAKGPLTDTVLGIVAADDVIAIAIFSLMLALAQGVSGHAPPTEALLHGLFDILGGIVLGIALGIPMAWLTGRLRPGEPAALEALGFVFLTAGLALQFNVSFLLASMVLGGTVAARAKHHTRAVHEIEGFSTPLLALFFIFAGFHLELHAVTAIGMIGVAYVLSRIFGKVLGCAAGGYFFRGPASFGSRLGWCLLPQAGVALGLALLAVQKLPNSLSHLMPLVIASTVIFEFLGPIATRWHLRKVGEIKDA